MLLDYYQVEESCSAMFTIVNVLGLVKVGKREAANEEEEG